MIALWLALQVEHYLTQDEALAIAVPGADRFVAAPITLTAEQGEAIRRRVRWAVPAEWTIYIGVRGDAVAGYAAITDVVGKYHPITFAVGVTTDAKVADVAVMTYREEIGSEVRERRYLDQFPGLGTDSRIQCTGARRDLNYISGATMSCEAIALGTRMVLHVIDEVFVRRPEAARAYLQEEPVRQSRMRMGAMLRIAAHGEGAKEAIDAAFEEVARIEKIITNYDPDSELSRLNAAAGDGPQEVSADLMAFLEAMRRWTDETDGAFDPTVGPVVRAWGFFDGNHRVPSDDELEALRKAVGRDRWNLERSAELAGGAALDPGAIGKGYAVDLAVAVLKARGITSALVDFGSTQYALGAPPGRDGWTIGVRDPFKEDGVVCTVTLRDAAFSTSGGYERCFEAGGKRYAHILDPRTLRPAEGTASASVCCADATAADALSTALYVLGPEAGCALAEKLKVETLLIDPEGRQTKTAGW